MTTPERESVRFKSRQITALNDLVNEVAENNAGLSSNDIERAFVYNLQRALGVERLESLPLHDEKIITVGGITLYPERGIVILPDGTRKDFSRQEVRFLWPLISNPGRVIPYNLIAKSMFGRTRSIGDFAMGDLRVYAQYVRRKIGDCRISSSGSGAKFRYINSVMSRGYIFTPESEL